MTEIKMDSNSALAGAIRASLPGKDIFIVLKDADGNVLASNLIDMFSTNLYETTIRMSPTHQRIDRIVEAHRAAIQVEYMSKGLL